MPPDGLGLGPRDPLGLNCFDLIHDASRGAGPSQTQSQLPTSAFSRSSAPLAPESRSQQGGHTSLSLPVIMLACVPWNPLSPGGVDMFYSALFRV